MLWFLIGDALQSKLSIIAIAFTACSLCLWAGSAATDKADVLDAPIKPMFDHGIIPIDESGETILLPHEVARIPFFRRLEHKTQPLFVRLALDAIKATPAALKPYLLGLP
jgi:hypothetical protein